MRKLLLAVTAGTLCASAFAQVKKQENKSSWTKGGLISINIAQGGSKNWTAGAEQFALLVNSYANLYANKQWGKNKWSNNLEVNYGVINTTSQGVRKNDDRLNLVSKYTRQMKQKSLACGLLFDFRSQFADTYDYNYAPKKRISGWFAPAYITFAPGVEWKPCKAFSIYGSLTAPRWVLFTNRSYSYQNQGGIKPEGGVETPLSAQYGVDPVQQVDPQFGAYFSAHINKQIMKNVSYRSRFDIYFNYLDNYPMNGKIYWTNMFMMHVNKWLKVTYNIDMIYDDKIKMFGPDKASTRTQYRSMLGVGLTTKL